MKKILAFLFVLVLAIGITGCGTTAPAQSPSPSAEASVSPSPEASPSAAPASAELVELTILAAASLTESLNELIANYASVAPNVKITVSYGSSGALQEQIGNGAPADIFFSAASKQMDALKEKDLMVTDSIVKLLNNEIVLVVPGDSAVALSKFEDAATDAVTKIALGDVASVPVGQYAQDTFTALNIWDKVSAKAVFGSDVKQVLSWVSAGEVDCGVVYSTDAASDGTVKVVASAPADTHKAIVYPVGIVKASAQQTAAADFISYLQSDEGLAVFTKYGFLAG
jgi:molybdate transport system substrate-binding protein